MLRTRLPIIVEGVAQNGKRKESEMPLTGTNNKCSQCIKKCKQFSQVKVIICPFFVAKSKTGVTCKAEETSTMTHIGSFGEEHSKLGVNGQMPLKSLKTPVLRQGEII